MNGLFHWKRLEENMEKYKSIGIYEKGDVIMCDNILLDDVVWEIALIREIKGEPLGRLNLVNVPVYDINSVDCDIVNIFSVEAWKKIYESDLLQDAGYDGSILNWLIKQKREIPEDLLDYVRDHFEGDTRNLLSDAGNLSNAKWLYKNGAILEPEGRESSVKEWWRMWRDKNHVEMYEYFFGKNGICA